ncbi:MULTISPECIES: helix-turn-helix domain-containing protein [Burkholderia]|uniref:helix-turn-helix domain-containing protein n=1 Tax=Burkholderia TaxID=32008 RepID=UPI00055644AB|nr:MULTISPECIES: helix-turn-helix transcriptional regulator [Burkholderia]AOJ13174.1 hypothetical protein WJ02_06025 [Burkholderia vietnamiensis]TCT31926.1 hypothetical protein EC918_102153 [Burkholderia vietnamiensis]SCZ28245.1 hypothetical protein SAMN02787148_106283 [Burkholderia vietnamiensis]SFX63753.1 hypothetical protein SAMN02787160_106284 [Burkholderia vietnamiensis]HDR9256385.1 helix-turn-helix transcriptional regulator [Burkholderia vietnamiensis]
MTLADRWLVLLREAVFVSSQADVARKLDLSRTTISLVLSGKYPGKTDRVAARVLRVFGQVKCTHTAELVTPTVCLDFAARRPPVNNPLALSHWRTCQTCTHRPVKGESK